MSSFCRVTGGDGLGHRNRFEQPEQRDRQAAARQRVNTRPIDLRQFERRQIGGNVADDLDALLVEMPIRDHGRHADQRQQQIGQSDMQPRVDPAQCERNGDRSQSDRQRGLVGLADVRQRQPNALEKVILARAGRGQAQQVFKLIEHQQDRSAEREADDHGVRNIASSDRPAAAAKCPFE